ncbi:MAG: hypothetical protein HY827_04920 [Actinobacteria bacterium]|nr:hypothetical protein [Actinomycetota bacterium]
MNWSRTKLLSFVAAGACAVALAFAGTASASLTSMIRDCTDDGSLQGNYSAGQLQNAIPQVPTDTDEYYYCSDLFRQALLNNSTRSHHKNGNDSGADVKAASEALTTREQRRRIRAKVDKAAHLGPSGATGQDGSGSNYEPLATSTAAPGTPVSLILAALGLLLVAIADLSGRLGAPSRLKNLVSGSRGRDDG